MITIEYDNNKLVFTKPEDLYNHLLTLDGKEVNITTNKFYSLDGLIVDEDGLRYINNYTSACLACNLKECDCDKPYFLILNYLKSKCNNNKCNHSKCNPLSCTTFVNNIEVNSIFHYKGKIALKKLFTRIYTNFRKGELAGNSGETVADNSYFKILDKFYNEFTINHVANIAVECLDCETKHCEDCCKRKINLARLYLKYKCKNNECNQNCFMCGVKINVDINECNNTLVDDILNYMLNDLILNRDINILTLFKKVL